MMTTTPRAVLATLLLLAAQARPGSPQCLTLDDSRQPSNPDARAALSRGQQAFSLDLMRTVSKASKDNMFFSPSSIYNALLLPYFGAANQTEKSLRQILRIPDSQDKLSIMQAYRLEKFFQAMRATNGSDSYELRSPSRVFASSGLRLRQCMLQLFEDDLVRVDFAADPGAARLQVNSWVEAQTRGNIKDLLQQGAVTPSTELVLVNAAYFKGLWQAQFLPENTRKEVFFISPSEKTLVSMMKQKGVFNHLVSERLGAYILELPYKGKDVSMFVFLPPFMKSDAVDSLIQRLDADALAEVVSEDGLQAQEMEVALPRFSAEQELELSPILEKMGVGDLFKPTADLSGLTEGQGVQLNEAVHKARIDVDEKGTEAAAATALLFYRSSRPLKLTHFVCNHPFVYLLFDRVSQTVLFSGVYRRPN
ncbi:serine protease inhibitor 88Ea-like [Bacillus rossius redtenbacheri]|uniref:serine protease inhibitor 88Ea-like n=1 Tax=Bacillus rossius redtenbacheri TaxID=93214 RepID=UPI002FDCA2C6